MTNRPYFRIVEIAGSGTFGTVCIGEDLRQEGHPVYALKVLKASHLHDQRILYRSRDEARMLAMLAHPNLVRVHELLDIEDRPVVVMERIAGISLDILNKVYPGQKPTKIAVEIARRAAVGLDAAFTRPAGPDMRPLRIVHRDIKPSNILISVHGEVKVVDFGIAKAFFEGRESETMSMVLGTRGYVAPERLDGGPDSPAGDVYALGLTLLELLLGKPVSLSLHPTRHEEILRRHLEAVTPDDVGPATLEDLRAIIAKMCAYELGQRYRPGDAAHALGSLLAHGGLHPDLVHFAKTRIIPAYEQRDRSPPQQHPNFVDVAFLEPPPGVVPEIGDLGLSVDASVRAFLATEGWERRLDDLFQILAGHPGWSEAPFHALLERSSTSRWRFWAKGPAPEQVVAAMQVLRLRRSPESLSKASALLKHTDHKIVSAARDLLRSTD